MTTLLASMRSICSFDAFAAPLLLESFDPLGPLDPFDLFDLFDSPFPLDSFDAIEPYESVKFNTLDLFGTINMVGKFVKLPPFAVITLAGTLIRLGMLIIVGGSFLRCLLLSLSQSSTVSSYSRCWISCKHENSLLSS